MNSKLDNKNVIHTPYDFQIDLTKGLAEYIWESFQKWDDTIAQIDASTGQKETYTEFSRRVIHLAQAMKKKGIKPNDMISYICFNNMDYAVVVTAAIFIGARFTPIDVLSSKDDIFHCLKLTEPRIVFCDNCIEGIVESALEKLDLKFDVITFSDSKKFMTFTEFIDTYKSEKEFKIYSEAKALDTLCIAYTSGTSGLCKGAQISHFPFLNVTNNVKNLFGEDKKNFMIFTLPYWITNIAFTVCALLLGETRVIYKVFDIKTLLKVMQDNKVNITLLNQLMINELINHPEYCVYDTSSVKYIMYGGSNIGVNQITEFRKIFPSTSLFNTFGMTEIAGFLFLPKKIENNLKSEDCQNLSHSVGSPNPGFYYKVIDPDTGKNLPHNEKGELRIKYPGMTSGYIKNPEATKEAFDEDGYFKTGDIVYYDENHCFYFVDRLKEIFKYKAFHISPTIIEDELLGHEGILDAATIGIPHDKNGELPMAVITPKKGVKLTEKEIFDYIKNRLPDKYHLRGGVKFVENIPKTNTGKKRRNYLRDLILKENKTI